MIAYNGWNVRLTRAIRGTIEAPERLHRISRAAAVNGPNQVSAFAGVFPSRGAGHGCRDNGILDTIYTGSGADRVHRIGS